MGEMNGQAAPSEIKIESGLPIPEVRKAPYTTKFPWRKMETGDSFIYPMKRENVRYTVKMASRAVAYRKKAQGESYVVRTVEENGQRVVRVWRTA